MIKSKILLGDCGDILPTLETDSVGIMITDPPYGIGMNKKRWDVSVPSTKIFSECLRVLRPGAFAFVMSSARQDVLTRMIGNLTGAGFNTSFSSIYWTYATGFPKAGNVSKLIDKRVLENGLTNDEAEEKHKTLDGAYTGMQLKPAVEIVIVAMKPLSEKTYLDQAFKNGHGCTWTDNCKIPFDSTSSAKSLTKKSSKLKEDAIGYTGAGERLFGGTRDSNGRFPANVLCEDGVLDDGIDRIGRKTAQKVTDPDSSDRIQYAAYGKYKLRTTGKSVVVDNGQYSRFFSLDAWFEKRARSLPEGFKKTFPWLITPKPSKSEKNTHLISPQEPSQKPSGVAFNEHSGVCTEHIQGNTHISVKPIKLMMWLITLGSREEEIVLDPFLGSGTTAIAAKALGHPYIGIEKEEESYIIAKTRVDEAQQNISEYIDT
jgi:site-specific DNA-methyltransferase (adenine-specific)